MATLISPKHAIERLKERKRLSQVLMLTSFVITFTLVRIITHLQKANLLPNHHGAAHVHHLVYGILLLIISGYGGLAFWSLQRMRTLMSVAFGIGAALTLDEFALWLYLKDVYWERQGRDSIDAVVIFIVLLSIILIISEVYDHRWATKIVKKKL